MEPPVSTRAQCEYRPWGPKRRRVSVCSGTGCLASKSGECAAALAKALEEPGREPVISASYSPGPYDAIRDGTDGLLASSRGEWLEALTRLAASSTLREELAGHARERVLAEYTVDQRADEWADAYRWAADHAGRGRMAARSLA